MPREDDHLGPPASNGHGPHRAKRAQGDEDRDAINRDDRAGEPPKPYAGFRRPTANYVRCPNQYLDLCVPHCSLHVARLVGYMIRETIGWTGRNGQPRREKVSVSYNELVKHARVSRAKLRGALDEANDLCFIRCVTPPRRQTAGVSARSGVYVLRWDESGELTRDLDSFRGFKFGGDCRTPLPNGFFDDVLRGEKHSVVRVVSAVLRHTVGYTNGITGERVEEAPLSYNRLLAFSPMDRKTLATALHAAEAAGYIRTVSAGRFSPDKRRQKAAVYAVRWDDEAPTRPAAANGSNVPPGGAAAKAVRRFTSSTRGKPIDGSRIPPAERFTTATRNGAGSPPAERFTSSTTRKTTPQRQQQTPDSAAVAPLEEAESEQAERLVGLGFTPRVARDLVGGHGPEEVRQQIDWLPRRNASRNRLGLLRRAIEEQWAEPRASVAAPHARQTAEDPDAARRQRELHERKLRPAYLAAVAGLEQRMQRERPADYAAFEAERVAARSKLVDDSSAFSPRVHAKLLARFDAEESRLEAFAEAFADVVPPFWTWDARRRGRTPAEAAGG